MNTLANVEYADNYANTKLNTNQWFELDIITKEKALFEATRKIYAIQGFKYTPEIIAVLTEIPDDLRQACCEVAIELAKTNDTDPHEINKRLGITSISFGSDSVSYDGKINSGLFDAYFNENAKSILNKYIVKAFRYV